MSKKGDRVYLVRCGKGMGHKNVIVHADWYKVEDGALTFRLQKDGLGSRGFTAYPETVRSFAAGYWLDVERIKADEVALFEATDE